MFKTNKKHNKVGLLCVYALIISLVIFLVLSCTKDEKSENEIFSYHGQTVQLLADGTFTASLAHGVRKSGTFTKTTENDRTIVSFNVNGKVEVGRIINNSLHLPREWDDGHGHGNVFPKVNTSSSNHGHNH
ncbi:MAG: hypothetical protein FWD13_06815 [Treponema sp.]|nr:hypothetical protein [Treponema sp.]